MQAPTYPPAVHFAQPAPQPFRFGIDTISVKEAVASPAIKQIMIEEAPQLKLILMSSQVQTHVSNWSIRSLRTIDLISETALTRIQSRIEAMPPSDRPAL